MDALLSEPGVLNGLVLAVVLGSLPCRCRSGTHRRWCTGAGRAGARPCFPARLALWRNKGAFAVYTAGWAALVLGISLVVGLVLGLLGAQTLVNLLAIPAGLALTAAFYISALFCFNDNFGGAAPGTPAANDSAAPPASPPSAGG